LIGSLLDCDCATSNGPATSVGRIRPCHNSVSVSAIIVSSDVEGSAGNITNIDVDSLGGLRETNCVLSLTVESVLSSIGNVSDSGASVNPITVLGIVVIVQVVDGNCALLSTVNTSLEVSEGVCSNFSTTVKDAGVALQGD
jgi:hypothetical protein